MTVPKKDKKGLSDPGEAMRHISKESRMATFKNRLRILEEVLDTLNKLEPEISPIKVLLVYEIKVLENFINNPNHTE